jgi:SAM-dependent methyltransferase
MQANALDEHRKSVMAAAQAAASLQIAFIGIVNGLFEALAAGGPADVDALAERATVDVGYVRRWADAAYAFGMLDADGERLSLTELGNAFRPSTPGTLMPFAVQSMLGAHMTERAAGLMKTGERPGEAVLGERATILPWFGPMLEANFAGFFAREILPNIDAYRALDARGGTAVDLGCGNGWYLRALAARYPHVRGLGIEGFDETVRLAREAAAKAGVADRLRFEVGDIYHWSHDEPAALIAMNRALHHVWDERERVFRILREALAPGGVVVIWEPRWPDDRAALREPRGRGLAVQNLSEHVQGNHFLRPAEIEEAMRAVGLSARTHLFAEGNEMVVVGTM